MRGFRWLPVLVFTFLAGSIAPALAQEGIATGEESQMEGDEAKRTYVRSVLDRSEVRTAARVAGADLDGALAGVDALEGKRLERATRQARLVDQKLDGTITLQVTTLIIILLVIILIIVAA